jgi:hypothetical protein
VSVPPGSSSIMSPLAGCRNDRNFSVSSSHPLHLSNIINCLIRILDASPLTASLWKEAGPPRLDAGKKTHARLRRSPYSRSRGSRSLPSRDPRRALAVKDAAHESDFRRRYVLTKNMAIGSARISLA